MKTLLFFSCICFCVLYVFARTTTVPTISRRNRLLGSKECTWGPSYWCSNITNAKSCNAVRHCIQTVWEHKTLPPDTDSVCQICVKMVTQARDQLQSNETQEELKEVFEGSCKLIPLKVISGECCKMVDEFIPELVETLASQMNPQVVCSVAGLCNNARIDKLLADHETLNPTAVAVPDKCDGCHTVVGKLQNKFDMMTRDQVLQGILKVCGRMSSLSDACTNIVITYFNDIYSHLQENLNPDEVCLMAGVCSAQFHTHNVEITPLSDSGRVNVAVKEDLPCELCEQLVQHLRELLIANTTESEFQRVLEGLCSQTKGFKDECMSIVDEYYPQIYNFLVSELNANSVCVMIGICKDNDTVENGPMWALLPPKTASKLVQILAQPQGKLIGSDEAKSYKSKTVKIVQVGSEVNVDHPELVQLPIERMMPDSLTLSGNTQLCTFCEYFLHFIQQEITDPKTEDKIKQYVHGACERLPKTIREQCDSFVDMYGDAFVALLAQEIDPSQVCPLLSLCPAASLQEVEIMMHSKPQDKPNCPLCLFAVTELEGMIKSHKSEENIKNALGKLCTHLPRNLAAECNDFVLTYADELVEMLVADLSPQEVCVYLKLCEDNSTKHFAPALLHKPEENNGDMTLTNEIPDDTVEGRQVEKDVHSDLVSRSPQCVICEFVMSKLEDELKDKTNEDEIKRIVHGVCNHLPKSVAAECNDFVTKYADMIIVLLQTVQPEEICSMIGLCQDNIIQVTEEILDCAICESTVTALDRLMDNPRIDHAMEHVLTKACLALPYKNQKKCRAMIDTYGDSFFHLVTKLADSKTVCRKVGLCANKVYRPTRQVLLGGNKCTWGPGYWCTSVATANECSAMQHCQEKVWNGKAPQ
ncbi:Saposin-related [Carabus blaptoides fortunei]